MYFAIKYTERQKKELNAYVFTHAHGSGLKFCMSYLYSRYMYRKTSCWNACQAALNVRFGFANFPRATNRMIRVFCKTVFKFRLFFKTNHNVYVSFAWWQGSQWQPEIIHAEEKVANGKRKVYTSSPISPDSYVFYWNYYGPLWAASLSRFLLALQSCRHINKTHTLWFVQKKKASEISNINVLAKLLQSASSVQIPSSTRKFNTMLPSIKYARCTSFQPLL